MKILVGLSWPYANGRLHIGHVASSLPADAIARFHRNMGNDVSFVSGSDCYGTPILVRAMKEGISPTELANKYHELHKADFDSFGFTFDNYNKTLSDRHQSFVRDFHTQMYKSKLIYQETAPQLYCGKCERFLPDRYVEGICPFCKKEAKGDSCDGCGKMLEPEDLVNPKCILCTNTPTPKEQTQLYIKMSALQQQIQKFFDERKESWATNAQGLTGRYLNEGLRDRAITRSINWGVPVPLEGWDDRRIYIWAENVLGYLSASEDKFIKRGQQDVIHYYVHGKDNIPFHSIILPSLILAHGGEYHLPDIIVASEHVTIGGNKLSKSKGIGINAHVLYENCDVDMIRYFFLRTVNDKRDSNFTAEEFVNIINGELVNNWGNLVNRTLSFIQNKFGGRIPNEKLDESVSQEIQTCKNTVHELMMTGKTATALKTAMDLVNFGNKYFAEKKPWVNDDKQCISDVIHIIRATTEMLEPFIPFGCAKVKEWLKGDTLPQIEVLYQRLNINEVKQWLT